MNGLVRIDPSELFVPATLTHLRKYNICKLFADDCKLYGPVKENDENKMQIDLTSLENWSKQWQLPFNASKCKVIHLGRKNPNRTYDLNDVILEVSDHEKDLGVIIDDNLKFRTHAAAAIKKANRTLGIIKKSYTSRDAMTISPILGGRKLGGTPKSGKNIWLDP